MTLELKLSRLGWKKVGGCRGKTFQPTHFTDENIEPNDQQFTGEAQTGLKVLKRSLQNLSLCV